MNTVRTNNKNGKPRNSKISDGVVVCRGLLKLPLHIQQLAME